MSEQHIPFAEMPFRMSQYRLTVIRIGMMAVAAANAIFVLVRLLQQNATGWPSPWWCNALGLVLVLALYAWYRGSAEQRVGWAIQGTAAIATFALLVPLAYGNASSVWWLSLVALAMVLMANRWVAGIWCLIVIALMAFAPMLIEHWMGPALLPEPASEALASRLVFPLVLFGIALAFRSAVRSQARDLRSIAAELESSNQVKDRFLQHMGHELRTPLHGVIALTDQALHGVLEEGQRARIIGAHASATVLLRQLNDVMDFASGRGDTALTSEPFRVRDVLTETLMTWAPQAQERGLALNVRVAEGWSEPRLGDEARFRQILDRLTSNAIRFTQTGKIEISVAPWAAPVEGLILTVSDTGIGMSDEVQANLFKPFSQGDASSTRALGGLGLGLARVHDLTRQMGGHIELHSVPGEGSRFTVYLAIPPAAAAVVVDTRNATSMSEASAATRWENTRALHVLVCEDDELCRELLIAGLAAIGHRCVAAIDGQAGWDRFCEQHFDLVLTDINMPKIDGGDLLMRIRTRQRQRNEVSVPVVAVTACTSAADANHLLRQGFDALLTKPFRLVELQRMLQTQAARIDERRPEVNGV